jgi:CRISPR-associated protein (Cas_Csd1)
MILAALKELAEAEGLMDDPDYEDKSVTRIIELSLTGEMLQLIDIREPDAKGSPRAIRRRVPKTSGRTSGIDAQFLYDKSDYLFGVSKVKGSTIWEIKDSQINAAIAVIKEALIQTGDVGLKAVLLFLENQKMRAENRHKILPDTLTDNEWFVFRIHGDEGLVSDRPEVKNWWKNKRRQKLTATAQCLITGTPCLVPLPGWPLFPLIVLHLSPMDWNAMKMRL